MAKDSIEISKYEILFKQEVAAFVDLREEHKNAKTKVKKNFLEKKIAKQKGRALAVGMKLAQYKEVQEALAKEIEENDE